MLWETKRMVVHPLQRLLLEGRVAGRERLVQDQDIGVHVHRDGEAQARLHPARVGPDRLVHELPDVRELLYLVEAREHLVVVYPQDQSVQHGVLAAGELGVEARAEPEDGRQPAVDLDRAGRGLQDAGDDPEQRALAGPVAAQDA
jgi:hypothetical protein